MTNGEVNQRLWPAIRRSAFNARVVAIHRQAAALREAITEFLEQYDSGDEPADSPGANSILDVAIAGMNDGQRSEFIERAMDEIQTWTSGIISDVHGFAWALDSFLSYVESETFAANNPTVATSDEADSPLLVS